jgi:hypothetical protein
MELNVHGIMQRFVTPKLAPFLIRGYHTNVIDDLFIELGIDEKFKTPTREAKKSPIRGIQS